MTELWENACALWFFRHMVMEFEIFERELDAARFAVTMSEYDTGAPVGLQYSDGRTVKVEDWKAFKDEEKVFDTAEANRRHTLPRPTRVILNPFDGAPARVDADEPFWLGVRPELLINEGKTGE